MKQRINTTKKIRKQKLNRKQRERVNVENKLKTLKNYENNGLRIIKTFQR